MGARMASHELMRRPRRHTIILRRGALFVTLLVFATPVFARDGDGALDLLITPNNGQPAILRAGDTFTLLTRRLTEIRIESAEEQIPLATTWTQIPGERFRGICSVPASVSAATYALVATSGGMSDRIDRAVYVVDTFPPSYAFAHLADPRIGSSLHWSSSSEILESLVASSAKAGAAFILLTGDLTESGTTEQFRDLLAALDTSAIPTLLSPGTRDRGAGQYETFFGPPTYAASFGRDAYLSVDTSRIVPDSNPHAGHARLQMLRREIKPARWALGFTHRYADTMDMRSQLILFVDNPLDGLLAGDTATDGGGQSDWTWNTTTIVRTPPAIDGAYRIVDVSSSGWTPRETEFVSTRQHPSRDAPG